MSATLSQRLRAETKDAHVRAERSGIMRNLLGGTITKEAYVPMLRNLAEIYRALEQELERHSRHPALVGIDLHALRRLDALERDIAVLDVDAGDAVPAPCPATSTYVLRLHELGDATPELLLAHAYVRYMGDLSGGLILKGIVAKTLGIDGDDGLAFFTFPHIADPVAFKRAFRDALDAAAFVVTSPDAVVREAQLGFALHERLFQELQ
ncbi:MAG: biliverdin-producing heme oxygenase [bacterium]